jgi:hypothetical protein
MCNILNSCLDDVCVLKFSSLWNAFYVLASFLLVFLWYNWRIFLITRGLALKFKFLTTTIPNLATDLLSKIELKFKYLLKRKKWWIRDELEMLLSGQCFFHGATDLSEPGSHYWGFTITPRHTTLSKTPLNEWLARRTDLYLKTHNTQRDRHPCPSGIRTHNPGKRVAANPRLRPRGHCDRQLVAHNWGDFQEVAWYDWR